MEKHQLEDDIVVKTGHAAYSRYLSSISESSSVKCLSDKCTYINFKMNTLNIICANCIKYIRKMCNICTHNIKLTSIAYDINLFNVYIHDICEWHFSYICTSKLCEMYYKNILHTINTITTPEINLKCCVSCTTIIENYTKHAKPLWMNDLSGNKKVLKITEQADQLNSIVIMIPIKLCDNVKCVNFGKK